MITISVFFYYKSKHYKAALQRFMSVLSNYPDVGYHKETLEYIAKCEASLSENEEWKNTLHFNDISVEITVSNIEK